MKLSNLIFKEKSISGYVDSVLLYDKSDDKEVALLNRAGQSYMIKEVYSGLDLEMIELINKKIVELNERLIMMLRKRDLVLVVSDDVKVPSNINELVELDSSLGDSRYQKATLKTFKAILNDFAVEQSNSGETLILMTDFYVNDAKMEYLRIKSNGNLRVISLSDPRSGGYEKIPNLDKKLGNINSLINEFKRNEEWISFSYPYLILSERDIQIHLISNLEKTLLGINRYYLRDHNPVRSLKTEIEVKTYDRELGKDVIEGTIVKEGIISLESYRDIKIPEKLYSIEEAITFLINEKKPIVDDNIIKLSTILPKNMFNDNGTLKSNYKLSWHRGDLIIQELSSQYALFIENIRYNYSHVRMLVIPRSNLGKHRYYGLYNINHNSGGINAHFEDLSGVVDLLMNEYVTNKVLSGFSTYKGYLKRVNDKKPEVETGDLIAGLIYDNTQSINTRGADKLVVPKIELYEGRTKGLQYTANGATVVYLPIKEIYK